MINWRNEKYNKVLRPLLFVFVFMVLLFGLSQYMSSRDRMDNNKSDNKETFRLLGGDLTFPIVYPSKLPDSYTLDQKSITKNNDIVTFVIQYIPHKSAAITIQAFPDDFDSSTLSGDQEFTTSIGRAYIIDAGNRTTGSLVSEKTWVIINAPEKMSTEDMKFILNNLTYID